MTKEQREEGMKQAEQAITRAIEDWFVPLPDWIRGATVVSMFSGFICSEWDHGNYDVAANMAIEMLKNLATHRPALLKAIYERMSTILPGEKVVQA